MAKTLVSHPRHVLEQIIDNALDAFVVIDVNSTVIAWTSRAETLFGWRAEEAVGRKITDLIIPPDFQQAHLEGMRRYLATGQAAVLGRRIEVPARHKEGRLFAVELSLTLIEMDGAPIFSAALRDITGRRVIEAQFRATFEQAAVGIAHVALDGRILRANLKLCDILGYSREELLGQEPRLLSHPEDRDIGAIELDRLLNGENSSSTYEKRYIRKNGEIIWLKITASLLRDSSADGEYFITVVSDITEARNMQEQAQRLAEVIEATPDFVGFSDMNGQARYINQAGRKLVGIPLEADLDSLPISRKYPPWAMEIVSKGIEAALRDGTWRGETALLSATGMEIPTSQVIIVHKDADGRPQYMSTIIRDMTERHQVEQTLRDADRRKDEFLAMLAHELRNPLAPISTAAQILKLRGLDESRVRQASDVITRQVDHMTELVDDLLDMSRVTRGLINIEQEVLDLGSIVADAIEQVRALIEVRHHHLVVQSPSETLRLVGDHTRLVQIIVNLLNNAAKYTPEGGQIMLRIEASDTEISISVRDNGIGIPPDVLPFVFDLFVQGKRTPDRTQGGLGLGLALVKNLLALHNGTVAARSEGVGKGSEFTIRLPRLHDTSDSREQKKLAAADHLEGNAMHVMVVDDNVDAAQTLSMLLESQGYRVVVEHSAEGALRCVEQVHPCVLLLDVGLPDMDGYQLASRVRRVPGMEAATLIAVTGYGQAEDIEQAMRAGFDHHMLKPLDARKLFSLLDSLQERQRA